MKVAQGWDVAEDFEVLVEFGQFLFPEVAVIPYHPYLSFDFVVLVDGGVIVGAFESERLVVLRLHDASERQFLLSEKPDEGELGGGEVHGGYSLGGWGSSIQWVIAG